VFAALALAIGILVPIAGLLFWQQGATPLTTTIPTPIQPSPANNAVQPSIIPQPVIAANLVRFSSYKELITYLESILRTEEAGASYTREGGIYQPYPLLVTAVSTLSGGISSVSGSISKMGSVQYSGTNVQVAGIDEPDIVKTNGKIIAVANGDKIYLVDPIHKKVVSVLEMNHTIAGLLLENNTLAVIMSNKTSMNIIILGEPIEKPLRNTELTIISLINITNPEKPVLVKTFSLSGHLISARLYRGIVYVVAAQPINDEDLIPIINNEPIPIHNILLASNPPSTYTNIMAINTKTLKYNVVSLLMNSASKIYMSYNHLIVVSPVESMYMTTVKIVLNASVQLLPKNIASNIAGLLKNNTYQSIMEAYKIFQNYIGSLPTDKAEKLIVTVNELTENKVIMPASRFYVFNIDGVKITYKGEFSINGTLHNQFCMDEYKNKYFVVATNYMKIIPTINVYNYRPVQPSGTGSISIIITGPNGERKVITTTVNVNTQTNSKPIVIIGYRRVYRANQLAIVDLDTLKTVSLINNIALGEDIKTARMIGDLFILVTYRNIDPLFAISIKDPYHPKIVGYLKIPGYNVYLHPLKDGLLLGIGVDRGNLTVSLYNISDPAHVVEISRANIGRYITSPVLYDYHAFTIIPDKDVFIIPLSRGWAWASGATTNTGVWCRWCFGFLLMQYSDNGLELIKIVELPGGSRSLYIDNDLYLVSQNKILVLDMQNYNVIGEIRL